MAGESEPHGAVGNEARGRVSAVEAKLTELNAVKHRAEPEGSKR